MQLRVVVLVLGIAAASIGAMQTAPKPAVMIEAEQTERSYWSDEQVDRWGAGGEEYLRAHPDSEWREQVYALMADWAWIRTEHSTGPPLAIIDRYLAEFPAGEFYGELDWQRVKLEHFVYEHDETDPQQAVDLAEVYEQYLRTRPSSRMADEIRLAAGRELHTAYEIITLGPNKNLRFRAASAERLRSRARALWTIAARSTKPEVAAQARKFLSQESVFYMESPAR